MSEQETAGFFDRLKKGLDESIAYSRGELTLKTTAMPAPPPPASRAAVVALRKKLQMSQSVFAATLNVSTKLVQSWEQGLRKPDRGELRLIEILGKRPEIVSNLILGNGARRPETKAAPSSKTTSKKTASAA